MDASRRKGPRRGTSSPGDGLRPEPPERIAYRGPDAFLVRNVDAGHKRDVWVSWEEDGRFPDLILELLSPSTTGC